MTAAGGLSFPSSHDRVLFQETNTKSTLDGYVRIWSTEAIHDSANAENAGKPRQLASMSNHSGTIHTVRFSPNGKYLASGADDKIVCIYALDTNPPSHASTFGMFSSVYVVVGR